MNIFSIKLFIDTNKKHRNRTIFPKKKDESIMDMEDQCITGG